MHLESEFIERSEEIQEIIESKATFTEKWGLTIFASVLLLLVSITWFVKFPDIIEVKGYLISDNSPKEIIAKKSGYISFLSVNNGEIIKKGDIISIVQTNADYKEILELKDVVDSAYKLIVTSSFEEVISLFKSNYNNLGPLQLSYNDFISAIQNFNDFRDSGLYVKKRKNVLADIKTIEKIKQGLESEKILREEDTLLSQYSYDMNEKLFQEKVISRDEFLSQKMKLLNKRMSIPQVNSNILANDAQRLVKLKELDQLDRDFLVYKINFEQSFSSLRNQLELWDYENVIRAQTSGVIYFNRFLQEGQFLSQDEVVGFIKPEKTKFYVQLFLPQGNLGKVNQGMKVQVRFDAYPYQEMGYLYGRVNYISKVAQDSGFLSNIILSDKLVTNRGVEIFVREGLKVKALIVTKERRLSERMFDNVRKIVYNNG